MTVRRLVFLSVCLITTATVVAAQPTKDAPPAPAPAPGSDAGSAVEMTEDAPPADMEGKDENPDAPKTVGGEVSATAPPPVERKRAGYPIEEALRPITLPKNMSEVAIGPRAQLGFGSEARYIGSDTLRARYGITRQIQLGLSYTLGGVYDDTASTSMKIGFHPGRAVGLDVTYLVRDFIGVRFGVPIYIDTPGRVGVDGPAVGISLGAPMKFTFGNKFALGALDDLLSIRINRFAPQFDHEAINSGRAVADDTNTTLSRGYLQFSAYGVYQRDAKMAFIGRVGLRLEDFALTKTNADISGGKTFIRAGVQYTPRKYLDVGISLGIDDLAVPGTFGPQGLVAFRI